MEVTRRHTLRETIKLHGKYDNIKDRQRYLVPLASFANSPEKTAILDFVWQCSSNPNLKKRKSR
jgi:hypothetical protein